jgi:poly(A) polymerase
MARVPQDVLNRLRREGEEERVAWPRLSRLLETDPAGREAARVLARLSGAGHEALLVGGCVRDSLLGVEPTEFDITTSASPDVVEKLFKRTVAVGRQFGVVRVVRGRRQFEVATFRSDLSYSDGRRPDAVEFAERRPDALRRDFTVNALYFDPDSGEVIDEVGGVRDLARGVLRAIGDPDERFAEDYLRMMRAARFAARLELEIEPATARAVRRLAPCLSRVSAERVQDELRRILTDREPARGLRLLDDLGLLEVIFPEVRAMKGCEQPKNYHPEGDVFVHSILTVEKLPPHPEFELALAALLHDVGKPEASRRTEPLRFHKHEQIGEDMTVRICRRLKMSNEETRRVAWLVKRHMYFKHGRELRPAKLKRLLADPEFDRLAEIHRADALASWGNLEDYNYVMAMRDALKEEEVRPRRLLTGTDLIEMGYEPGPGFKEVLEAVEDAQLDGAVATRREAADLARKLAGEAGLTQRPNGKGAGQKRTKQKTDGEKTG